MDVGSAASGSPSAVAKSGSASAPMATATPFRKSRRVISRPMPSSRSRELFTGSFARRLSLKFELSE